MMILVLCVSNDETDISPTSISNMAHKSAICSAHVMGDISAET